MSDREKAIELIKKGDQLGAVKFLEDKRNSLPENEAIQLTPLLAELYLAAGQEDKTIELLTPHLHKYDSDPVLEGNLVYSQYLIKQEPDKAQHYISEYLNNFPESNNPKVLSVQGNLLSSLGQIFNRKNELNTAIQYFKEAYTILGTAKNEVRQAAMKYNIASTLGRLGKYEEAIEEFNQLIQTQEAMENTLGVGYSKMEMGGIFEKMGLPDKAMECYKEEYEIFEKHGGPTQQAWALTDLGNGHLALGEAAKAMECYNKCLPQYLKGGDDFTTGNIYTYMSSASRQLGQYNEAVAYANKAITCYTTIENQEKTLIGLINKIWAEIEFSDNVDFSDLVISVENLESRPSEELIRFVKMFLDSVELNKPDVLDLVRGLTTEI